MVEVRGHPHTAAGTCREGVGHAHVGGSGHRVAGAGVGGKVRLVCVCVCAGVFAPAASRAVGAQECVLLLQLVLHLNYEG